MTDGIGYGNGSAYGHGYGVGIDDLLLSNQISNGNQGVSDRVSSASADNIRETAEVGRDVADAVRDAIGATNQIGNLNLQSSERNGGEVRAAVERVGGAVGAAVERNGGDIRHDVSSSAGVIRDVIGFNANQASRDASRVISEICDVRKEMSEGFGDTKLEMCKQHADIQLEASRNHAAIQLEAAKNAADIKLELCKCCADQKEEHGVTRALIASQALDNAQSRIGELQNEVNLQRILAGQKGNN